jgi:DNA processing protein
MHSLDGRHIILGEPDFSNALAAIPDALPVLCMRGHSGLSTRPIIGVVGTHNAPTNGRRSDEQRSRDHVMWSSSPADPWH